MDAAAREQLEQPVRAAIIAEDARTATTLALRLYGTELYGFMVGTAREQTTADEAFSELCVTVWKHLAEFRWESSLRSWMYAIARRLVMRIRIDGHRRERRATPLELAPEIAEVAANVRTATLEILRTSVKDAFRALRDELPEDDQELLALRVDRDMSWRDIARIVDPDGEVDVRAAALRKRFERVKAKLRELADARGLLPTE